MKLMKPTLQMLVLLSSVTSLVVGCTRSAPNRTEGGQAGGVNAKQEAQKEIWTCPMHPQIRQDGPGKCPICGMDLVKADHGHEAQGASAPESVPSGHADFHLNESRQQMIGVKLGTVEKKPLFKSIDVPGRVAFDPELYTAQNEYLEALRQLGRVSDSPIPDVRHSAQRMLESAKLRLKIIGLSDQQIKNLANSQNTGSSLLIPSPGDNAWIYAEVFEMDLPSIKPGLSAKIRGGFLGAEEVAGRVVSVDRVINTETRSAKVRIQLLNARPNLRPEAFVNVSILAPLGEQVTVPFDAVFDTGKEAWVFVAGEKGAFEPRLVTVKFRAGDEIAVGSGLKGGERIAVSGNFLLDSESRLRGVQAAASASVDAPKVPSCPEGQFWHAEMKHCMKKTD